MNKKVKISDVCDILNGYAFKSQNYVKEGIRVIRITNVQKGYIEDRSPEYYPLSSIDEIGKYVLKENDLLVSLTGNVGRVAVLSSGFLPAALNQRVACVRIRDEKKLNKMYLFSLLNSDLFERACIYSAQGIAQKNMSTEWLKKFEIELPPIEEQKKIAEILDKASNLISFRKKQIEKLDLLVKSRFIEMFGDEKYPVVKTEEVCEYITKGTTPKANDIVTEYSRCLVPYLKVYNLSFDGSMQFEEKPQYVSVEIHNKFLARSKVFPNDVLMNIVGPPLGKFAIVPNTYKEWNINQAIVIFRATDRISPIYLLYALKQPNVLRPFIDSAVGIRQQNLSLLQCRNLAIPLPPIELQNQFADFVNQIDKLKFELQQCLEKMDLNYKALMQKYFG